jgi:predicted NAD-dependent protein-ADP-ribosyltransferase YbiA (DUF1768 family)
MRVEVKPTVIVLISESDADAELLTSWSACAHDHVFAADARSRRALVLRDLGARPEATREPINVMSTSSDPSIRLISNFADTPFVLDHRVYASVEGFWQGLKFPDKADRARVARLTGGAARRAGEQAANAESFVYDGALIRTGCWDHWALMRAACSAKFTQHQPAREALLKTGDRPLVHRVRRDSRTIPGVIMAEIWMDIRARLRRG